MIFKIFKKKLYIKNSNIGNILKTKSDLNTHQIAPFKKNYRGVCHRFLSKAHGKAMRCMSRNFQI